MQTKQNIYYVEVTPCTYPNHAAGKKRQMAKTFGKQRKNTNA